MTAYGDSHTGFSDNALLAGGLGGGAAIGGALVAGVMNHLAGAAARRKAAWNEETWQNALALSEMLHKRTFDRAVRAETECSRLRAQLARTRSAPDLATARALLRR